MKLTTLKKKEKQFIKNNQAIPITVIKRQIGVLDSISELEKLSELTAEQISRDIKSRKMFLVVLQDWLKQINLLKEKPKKKTAVKANLNDYA